jgi:hypothetical protein
MPKRKRPTETPEEQFKRFLETAKELEVEKSEKEVEKAFKDLSRAKTQKVQR